MNVHYGDVLIKYGSILDVESDEIPYIAAGKESKKQCYLSDGDVIIADTAEDETVGKCTEITNTKNAKIEAGLHTIPCHPRIAYAPMFLGYYMNSPYYHKQLIPLMQGVKVLSVSKSNIGNTLISAPASYPEQEKIVELLHLLDCRMRKQQEVIDNLKKYKRGVTKAIFNRELTFSSDGSPYPQWDQKYIGEICKIQTGKSNTEDETDKGIYPFYVRSPVVRKSFRYLFDCEAVLTVGDGVGTGKVFHYVTGKFDLHQRVYAMTDFRDVSGKYFYYYFSHFFYERVMRMTAKTSVDSVRYEMIDKMPILIPCEEEQSQIVLFLDCLEAQLKDAENELLLLDKLKSGLLQQLFI